jgi:hypothetical protein
MVSNSREVLADVLERVKHSSSKGIVVSADISRSDREFLQERGYLKDIVKGWYYLTKPSDEAGASTAWYGHLWSFFAVYLQKRFGDDYCLSALSSLDVHLGVNRVPGQVVAIAGSRGKTQLDLPYRTSLLVYEDSRNLPKKTEVVEGLRVMPLALALCKVPEVFFRNRPVDAELALRAIKTVGELIRVLLERRDLTSAGRLAGAYRHLGDEESAQQIVDALEAAGHACEPVNPFEEYQPCFEERRFAVSPYAGRIESTFQRLRKDVLSVFKNVKPTAPKSAESYLKQVEDVYESDAYNSLSIEGYEVTTDLIHRIRAGAWDPEHNPDDQRESNALAAKGYLQAFRLVESALSSIYDGQDAVEVVEQAYQKWYRALFSASVKAGIHEAHHLAGFRHDPVYIRGSRHVPPPYHAVPDAMDAFWSCMRQEESPVVRAVLGHFVFVFIHPYMDGNGRMARFLMNAMFASGRYPWTIVRVTRRNEYMKSIEHAVVEQDIKPFAKIIREEMKIDWSKEVRKR